MRKTIGIFAHVDAGKTTLSQQILLQTGALRAGGGRALYLDDAPLEQQRGITIFSSAAPFSHGGEKYTLIDTPGHLDFGAEAERCVSVLDCAVLLVSATDGIQGHTEALWRLLARYRVPVFLFLNKTDRPTADPDGVLAAIRQRFSADCILFDGSLFSAAPPEAAFEAVAEREDALLEAYLAGEATPQQLLSSAAARCGSRRLFPVFAGSALTGEGVEPLLCGLDRLLATDYEKRETAPFAARIWQIRHDKQGVRLSFLKVLSGRLSVKASAGAAFSPRSAGTSPAAMPRRSSPGPATISSGTPRTPPTRSSAPTGRAIRSTGTRCPRWPTAPCESDRAGRAAARFRTAPKGRCTPLLGARPPAFSLSRCGSEQCLKVQRAVQAGRKSGFPLRRGALAAFLPDGTAGARTKEGRRRAGRPPLSLCGGRSDQKRQKKLLTFYIGRAKIRRHSKMRV